MSIYYEDTEVAETSFYSYLHKARNGHLVIVESTGYRRHGQDWGETNDQWHSEYIRIGDLAEELRPIAIRFGRELKPGEWTECYLWDFVEEDA